MRVAIKHILLAFLLSFSAVCRGQENPLERRLSLTIEQVKLEDALFLISETGSFNFCYNSKLVKAEKLVDVNAADEPVSSILKKLFGDELDLVPVGNHVILRKKIVQSAVQPERQIEISGLVIDDHSGQRIPNVTVFEDFRKKVVQTDANGRFSIQLPSSIRSVALSFGKSGYIDTSIVIIPQKSMRLIVGVAREGVIGPVEVIPPTALVAGGSEPDQNPPSTTENPASETRKPRRTVPVQISVFPMVGSNGINQFGTDNYFSLNVFAGMTKGVKGFELGGVANVNLENMYGLQIAGAANVVGADAKGFQIATDYNYVAQDAVGFQIAGGGNHAKRNMKGWQLSLGANIVENEAAGLQMTALVNYARKIKGVQFGLINISDTIKGATIGIINISKNGFMRVEVSGNDVLHNNLRFKSGTNGFYTILEGGVRWNNAGYAGYGVGGGIGARAVYAKKRMFSEFELDVLWMNENSSPNFNLNLISKFSATIGVKVVGPMEFQIGPTYVYHHSTVQNQDGSFNSQLGFFPFLRTERPEIGLLQQMWVGIQGGIQFDLNWRRSKK